MVELDSGQKVKVVTFKCNLCNSIETPLTRAIRVNPIKVDRRGIQFLKLHENTKPSKQRVKPSFLFDLLKIFIRIDETL